MKKRILSLLLCGLFFSLSPSPALFVSAEKSSYARISEENVYLYASADEASGLFILPCTYYVRTLSEENGFTYVCYSSDDAPYHAVYGYCKSDKITPVSYTPARPFLYYTLTVEYRLDGYRDDFSDDLSFVSVTYGYYGDFTVGSSVYCYVTSGEKTGYIPKTMTVDYERNDDYPPEEESPHAQTDPALPAAQIALAVVLCALFLFLAACLLFKKPAPREEKENDPFSPSP